MPLNMFHHVKASGGTIHEPTVKIGFIQGIDRELISVQMPDMEALCNQPVGNGVPIPTFANIYSVTNEAEINNLNNGATTTYKPRTFILVNPFLCQDVSEVIIQHEGNAKQVLLKVIEKMKDFDMNIQGVDPLYVDKAKDK